MEECESEKLFMLRQAFISKFCFTIPDPDSLAFIERRVPKSRPIVDPLAGTGCWAHQLEQRGYVVRASDRHPTKGKHSNTYHRQVDTVYHPVRTEDALEAVAKVNRAFGEDYTLMLSWVPYDDTIGEELLKLSRAPPGHLYRRAGGLLRD